MTPSPRWLARLILGLVLASLAVGPVSSQSATRGHGAEANDMELVGHDDDLQGRSAGPRNSKRPCRGSARRRTHASRPPSHREDRPSPR